MPRGKIEVVEATVLRTDPEPALAVAHERVHGVDGKTVHILGIVLIERDAARRLVQLRQAAVHHSHIDGAVRPFDERAHVLAAEQRGRLRVLRIDAPCLQVTAHRIELEAAAAARADPDVLSAVLIERGERDGAEPLGRVRHGLARGAIELEEAFGGGEPQRVLRFHDRGDAHAVTGHERVVDEAVALAVVAAQAERRADPQRLLAVFEDDLGVVVEDARRIVGLVAVDDEAVPVVSIEALARAHPEEALAVLDDGLHQGAREAVVRRELPELQPLSIGTRMSGSAERRAEQGTCRKRSRAHRIRLRSGRGAGVGSTKLHQVGERRPYSTPELRLSNCSARRRSSITPLIHARLTTLAPASSSRLASTAR